MAMRGMIVVVVMATLYGVVPGSHNAPSPSFTFRKDLAKDGSIQVNEGDLLLFWYVCDGEYGGYHTEALSMEQVLRDLSRLFLFYSSDEGQHDASSGGKDTCKDLQCQEYNAEMGEQIQNHRTSRISIERIRYLQSRISAIKPFLVQGSPSQRERIGQQTQNPSPSTPFVLSAFHILVVYSRTCGVTDRVSLGLL